jgi:8-oxo-dGTP pyrophosphatase MutT (NUDIX family)
VIEQNDRFLLVEELIDGKMTLNQPAGHLESGESLIEAAIRETQEETAWQFKPTALTGIYRWQLPENGETYMRFCFTGEAVQHDPQQMLDADIHQAIWLTKQEFLARQDAFRSPLVLDCVNDYLAGCRYPLTLLKN